MGNFTFCQNDWHGSAEYDTYSMNKESKLGFICINQVTEFVAHVSFDNVKDYETLLDAPAGSFNALKSLKVGESCDLDDALYIRLW